MLRPERDCRFELCHLRWRWRVVILILACDSAKCLQAVSSICGIRRSIECILGLSPILCIALLVFKPRLRVAKCSISVECVLAPSTIFIVIWVVGMDKRQL